jgi:hypothetical protein
VRAIVDFSVPAIPFTQNMHGPSRPSAHVVISSRTLTRVLWIMEAKRVMLPRMMIEGRLGNGR